MKFPISWLKDYLPTSRSIDEISEILTVLGIEVEGVEVIDSEEVIEISLTPNLAHCLGLIGIARELAASTGEKITLPKEKAEAKKGAEPLTASIEAPGACPRYAARLIKGIRVAPSPDWLKKRIELAGMRSVNNIVDITNYVMLEFGHPLHAFDFEKLAGERLVVRFAKKGEKLKAIDGKEYFPTEQALLICDAEKPVALAGVMGSLETEVSDTTRDVVLEAAYFSPADVRRTSKQLGLSTEASRRFERHTDWAILTAALDRAAYLLHAHAGADLSHGGLDCRMQELSATRLSLRLGRVNKVLGTQLALSEVELLLKRLGFETVTDSETIAVTVPSYRGDITAEIDLIEEVARLYGYDNVHKKTSPSLKASLLPHSPIYLFEKRVRQLLLAEELQEFLTCDLISPQQAESIAPDCAPSRSIITLLNPSSVDLSVLRPSLLPNLLHVVKYNNDHSVSSIGGFEVGRIHFKTKEGYIEPTALGIVLTGDRALPHWDKKREPVDFFDLKGVVENLLKRLKIKKVAFQPSSYTNFHPGRQAAILVAGHEVGILGEVHPKTCAAAGVNSPTFFAEINLEDLAKEVSDEIKMVPMATLPPSVRDWTLTVFAACPFQRVLDLIEATCSSLLEEVSLLDVYQSEKLGSDKKNLTFRFVYRDLEKTVSHEVVEAEHNRIQTEVMQRLHEEKQIP